MSDRLAEIRGHDQCANVLLIRSRPESAIAHRRELLRMLDEALTENVDLREHNETLTQALSEVDDIAEDLRGQVERAERDLKCAEERVDYLTHEGRF